MDHAFLIFATGLVAGAMNAIAGGGTFLALPVLVFTGVPALNASTRAAPSRSFPVRLRAPSLTARTSSDSTIFRCRCS